MSGAFKDGAISEMEPDYSLMARDTHTFVVSPVHQ